MTRILRESGVLLATFFRRLEAGVRSPPEGKKALVHRPGLAGVSGQGGCASEPEMRERVEWRGWGFATMIEDVLKLDIGCPAILQLKVCSTSNVGGPELR
jgi:hypothetical protein